MALNSLLALMCHYETTHSLTHSVCIVRQLHQGTQLLDVLLLCHQE